MVEFISSIWDSFALILADIPAAIKNDLIFPQQPRSPEEQFISKMIGQRSMITSQQDRLTHQTGVIQEQSLGIRNLENLNIQKDNEIKDLKCTIQSLEFQLQVETSRSKRWR
jgi:predicted RNase H-like nuclease (RuvC/YqgF family)